MADSAYYAWSQFNLVDKDGKKSTVNPGDKVTASSLGVDDAEFQAYVESGAVRTAQFPKLPEGYTGSPREFRLSQLAAAARGEEYDIAIAAAGGEAYAEPNAPAPSEKK